MENKTTGINIDTSQIDVRRHEAIEQIALAANTLASALLELSISVGKVTQIHATISNNHITGLGTGIYLGSEISDPFITENVFGKEIQIPTHFHIPIILEEDEDEWDELDPETDELEDIE